MNPKLIPIEGTQVALGGVSRTKVYGLIDDGLLTRVKIGSRAFITSDSIDTYIESLTVKENVFPGPETPDPDHWAGSAPSDA